VVPYYTKHYDAAPPIEHLPILLRLVEKAAFSLNYNINYVSLKNADAGNGRKGLYGQIFEERDGTMQIEIERSLDDWTAIETLVHELAHGIGEIDYMKYRYDTAEKLVETITRQVLRHYNWPTSEDLEETCDGVSDYVLRKYREVINNTSTSIISAIDSVR
jgi:hypothetical protein